MATKTLVFQDPDLSASGMYHCLLDIPAGDSPKLNISLSFMGKIDLFNSQKHSSI